ncbi:hypothetical protein FA13DRAFT_1772561 [Coprinellus micaceus]|uniref:Uncharacterized protein n=1 Tax=Coprinellus micaceus TaxID=71717 RepID=A0A4Y7TMJ5_COPMI|nr:hypothetical protein FA13DRAFT_1772561 [Coprinellus micaceus]
MPTILAFGPTASRVEAVEVRWTKVQRPYGNFRQMVPYPSLPFLGGATPPNLLRVDIEWFCIDDWKDLPVHHTIVDLRIRRSVGVISVEGPDFWTPLTRMKYLQSLDLYSTLPWDGYIPTPAVAPLTFEPLTSLELRDTIPRTPNLSKMCAFPRATCTGIDCADERVPRLPTGFPDDLLMSLRAHSSTEGVALEKWHCRSLAISTVYHDESYVDHDDQGFLFSIWCYTSSGIDRHLRVVVPDIDLMLSGYLSVINKHVDFVSLRTLLGFVPTVAVAVCMSTYKRLGASTMKLWRNTELREYKLHGSKLPSNPYITSPELLPASSTPRTSGLCAYAVRTLCLYLALFGHGRLFGRSEAPAGIFVKSINYQRKASHSATNWAERVRRRIWEQKMPATDPPICLANPDLYVTKTPPKFVSPPSIMRRNWSELGHSSDIYVTNPEAVSESSDPQAPKLGSKWGRKEASGWTDHSYPPKMGLEEEVLGTDRQNIQVTDLILNPAAPRSPFLPQDRTCVASIL